MISQHLQPTYVINDTQNMIRSSVALRLVAALEEKVDVAQKSFDAFVESRSVLGNAERTAEILAHECIMH